MTFETEVSEDCGIYVSIHVSIALTVLTVHVDFGFCF